MSVNDHAMTLGAKKTRASEWMLVTFNECMLIRRFFFAAAYDSGALMVMQMCLDT